MRILGHCCLVLLGLVFCSSTHLSTPLELDSPLPKEEGVWKQIPGQVTLFLGEDAKEETIHFIAESHEEAAPIVLALEKPTGKEDVDAFLQKCRAYIEQKGIGTSAIVAAGKSMTAHVQQWLAGFGVNNDGQAAAPNLTGVVFGSPVLQILPQKGVGDSKVKVKYGFQLPKVHTTRDLRKMWTIALIQRMTGQRLLGQKIPLQQLELSSFLLPEKSSVYEMESSELKDFLHAIQEVKQVGFTIEELTEAKQFFLSKIGQLQTGVSIKKTPLIVSFHAEGFLRNLGLLSYAYFLESAPSLIESMTPVDVAIALNECYDEGKRSITLFADSSEVDQLEMLMRQAIDESETLEIEQFSPAATEAEPNSVELFYKLPLHDWERDIIYKIIDTMARDNVIKLGLKRKSMEKKGRKIRHVHPLRFLGHIYADRHLKSCMREISRSSFKWNGFIDGMKDRVKEEEARGNLYQYVPGFAEVIKGDQGKIRHYLEKHDWDGFLRCML